MPRFEIVERPPATTAVVHAVVPMKDLSQFFGKALGDVATALEAQGLAPSGPPFALYFGMPAETVELEAGFPVEQPVQAQDQVRPGTLPGGRCVRGLHVGPYDTLTSTYADLARWMEAQELRGKDTMWEVYLSPPSGSDTRTEIVWPVD